MELVRLVHHAWRVWRRAPGTALAIVALVALGVGGVVALFSPLYSLVLEPLPLPQPDRLVRVGGNIPLFNGYTNAVDDQGPAARLFTKLMVYAPVAGFAAEAEFPAVSPAKPIGVLAVTPQFFETLGVLPRMGASFVGKPVDSPAVVVSDRLWRNELDLADNVLGTVLPLGRQPRPVVGVMPPGFDFPGGVDAWVLIGSTPYTFTGLQIVGRLRPDLTVDRAAAELKAMSHTPTFGPSGQFGAVGPLLQDLQVFLRGETGDTLWALWAVSALFLLLACVGVANLLLAQGIRRHREVVVQLALGSGRWRLVRQFLIEMLVLVVCGTALGLWLSTIVAQGLRSQLPQFGHAPLFVPATFAFVVALGLVVTLVCGVAPALYSTRVELDAALKSTAARTGTVGPRQRLFAPREWLSAGQLVIALALLIGTGLLQRSITAYLNQPLGLDPERVVVFGVDLPYSPGRVAAMAKFQQDRGKLTPDRRTSAVTELLGPHLHFERIRNAQFLQDAYERLERLPNVLGVGVIDPTPFTPEAALARHAIYPASALDAPGGRVVRSMYGDVSPNGFELLGIRLVAGRTFTPADVAAELAALDRIHSGLPPTHAGAVQRGLPGAVIINEALAQRLWPGENPIGKPLGQRGGTLRSHTVVGVVSNFHWTAESSSSGPALYFPVTGSTGFMRFVAKLGAGASIEQFRRDADVALRELMPGMPQVEAHGMTALTEAGLRNTRLASALLVGFSVLGTVVATLGVYAASALTAAARTREIGIRLALGATAADVRWLVVSRTVRLLAVAVPAGLLAGWALARQLSHLLFVVTPLDLTTSVVGSSVLVAAALLASAFPAVRAGATAPVVALRCE